MFISAISRIVKKRVSHTFYPHMRWQFQIFCSLGVLDAFLGALLQIATEDSLGDFLYIILNIIFKFIYMFFSNSRENIVQSIDVVVLQSNDSFAFKIWYPLWGKNLVPHWFQSTATGISALFLDQDAVNHVQNINTRLHSKESCIPVLPSVSHANFV